MEQKSYRQLEKFCKKKLAYIRESKNLILQDFFLGMEEEFQREGFRQKFSDSVKNILIVRLDVIGDFILTTGFIREVRKNFPKARITLIVSPLAYQIAEPCPYVNEVLKFDGKIYGKNIFDVLENAVDFCRDNLWQKHFDCSFNPQWGSDNLGGLFLSYFSGARKRIGYGHYPHISWGRIPEAQKIIVEMDNFLLTDNIITPVEVVSEIEKSFYLLIEAGFQVNDLSCELWFNAEDYLRAKEFLKNLSDKKKVIIGLGAGDDNRKYPVQKLAAALKEIAKENVAFIIVGGKSEEEAAKFLEKNLPHNKILNLVGKTTLRETEAVIAQADFYIGNVSGVMHMAAAGGKPLLAIYREAQDKEKNLAVYSEFLRFPPWQTTSVILRPNHALDDCADFKNVYGGCRHREAHCITQVEPEEIIEGFKTLANLK